MKQKTDVTMVWLGFELSKGFRKAKNSENQVAMDAPKVKWTGIDLQNMDLSKVPFFDSDGKTKVKCPEGLELDTLSIQVNPLIFS